MFHSVRLGLTGFVLVVATFGHARAQESSHAAARSFEDQQILSQTPAYDGEFGTSVCVDGDTLVCSEIGENGSAAGGAGISSFRRDASGAFVLEQFFVLPGAVVDFEFWFPRLMALEGDRLVVAHAQVGPPGAIVGSLGYVFERTPGGPWTLVAELPVSGYAGEFLRSIDVDLDGDRAAIVTDGADNRAFVFERAADGSWSEVADLTPPPSTPFFIYRFDEVALTGDWLFLSDPDHDESTLLKSVGVVRAYRSDASGSWAHAFDLYAPDFTKDDLFGESIDADGDLLVVSAPGDYFGTSAARGAFHVYRGLTSGVWAHERAIASPVDLPHASLLTRGVAVDGGTIVGLLSSIPEYELKSRATVYVEDPGGDWVLARVLELSQQDPTDFLARASVSGTTVVLAGSGYGEFPPPFVPANAPGKLYVADLPVLRRDVEQVSAYFGGAQELSIDAGAAGRDGVFLVLGSATGTWPQLTLAGSGVVLPLVPDAYTQLLIDTAGASVVAPLFGALDAEGRATARVQVPPLTSPSLVGVVLHHAGLVFDPATLGLVATTNAQRLRIVP